MGKRYDLVAIGGGTAGLVATLTATGLGARTALIERDRTGGDCLWTGCVPSKALLASAARAHAIRTADRFGIRASEPEVDFGAVMRRVHEVIEAAGERDTPEYLRSEGVDLIEGEGRFTGPGRISAGGREISFRTALIGTGSRPAMPPLPGIEAVEPLTSESVFELAELPERLAVLGGGPIGCELSQAFARLGSRVTLVESEGRLLPREEPFAGELLAKVLRNEGVDVRTRVAAAGVEPDGQGGSLRVADGNDVPFDRILVATGRTPVTDGLGLDAVGVETDRRGAIVVDDRLRTTGDRIFAAGDVAGELRFTHVAGYHALVAMANGLFRARRKVERDWTPWATFTDPEVAHVGLTEEEARSRHGDSVEVYEHDYANLDRALTSGDPGSVKLVAGRRGRLLGATIVGPAAGESIAEAARLVRDRRKVADLSQMIHAYPTFTEGAARAADDYWRRRYMTPGARRWFRPLLAALRRIDHPR
ncbi:MAG TPA: FAD-dependent oxidoreductase [Solirubrobacterales bacterium]|nr:FAD-dependent oxidoreductase [Solirubrobacterales bacterium]